MIRKKVKHIYFKSFIDNADIINTHNYFTSYSEFFSIKWFGYLAAGYTTLFSYMLFALLHYIFMKKICREHLNNIKPYNGTAILIFSVLSIALGLGCSLFYQHTFIRYVQLAIIFFVILLFRKKISNTVKKLFQIRNQSNE